MCQTYSAVRCITLKTQINETDDDFIMATESNLVFNRTSLCDRFSILLPEEYNCLPDEESNYEPRIR